MRALLFDLDNTLIDRDKALKDALCSELVDPDATNSLLMLDDRGNGDRQIFLNAWAQAAGTMKSMYDLSVAICHYLQPDHALLRSLKAIKQQVPIGIITNGSVKNQSAKMKSAGLDTVFNDDQVWISGHYPFAKPDKRIFELACDGLGVKPANTLYVGDNPVNDISGARDAGLDALLVTDVIDAAFVDQLVLT